MEDSGTVLELEEAKRLIQDFCETEYDHGVDFSDLTDIGIAYTTITDDEIPIQVSVNLVDFSVTQTLDDQFVEQRKYKTLRELIDKELVDLDFEVLTHWDGAPPAELLANALKAAQEPESAPEQVEIDGGQIVPPPLPIPRQPPQERHNFQITDDNLGVGGEKTKYQYNVTAIRTLKQIEAEGRLATPEEQETLSRYVGWGGIAKAFDPDDPKWTNPLP